MVTFGWQQQTVSELMSWQHIVSALVLTCAGQHYWAKLRRDGHWVSDPLRAGPDAAAGGSRHVVRDPAANLSGLVTSFDGGLRLQHTSAQTASSCCSTACGLADSQRASGVDHAPL